MHLQLKYALGNLCRRVNEGNVQCVPFLLLQLQVRITQKVFGAFISFWSQIKVFRMTICKRKFQINQTSSFFANSNLLKLDFSEKMQISYFCMKHNLDSLPCFTLFIIAQKPTNEYCWSFAIRVWTSSVQYILSFNYF